MYLLVLQMDIQSSATLCFATKIVKTHFLIFRLETFQHTLVYLREVAIFIH